MDDLTFLEELISIPSPSGHESAVAKFLAERMEGLGFQAGIDKTGNVVGVVGSTDARRRVALIGHMDTVEGAVPVLRQGNLLFGRGAVDAKGPLAAMVLAAARVAPNLKDTQLMVVGAVQEEATSSGARYLADNMDPPSFAIVGEPSGWEGITIGYKGVLGLEYVLQQATGHRADGRATPAERAVGFWNKLRSYSDRYNAKVTRRFDALEPHLDALRTSSDGLVERVAMSISCRTPPSFPAEGLWDTMLAWAPPADLSMRCSDPAVEVGKNNELIRAMLRAIREEGGRPRFKLKTGTSDMNVLAPAWGCPMVAYGPGDSALDHHPEEHLDLQEFQRAVNVLARALDEICCGPAQAKTATGLARSASPRS